MKQEYISLTADNGDEMRAFVARPELSPAPAVIVFQEAFGLTDHIRDVAGRFAGLGYVAIAPELFHRTAPPGWTGDYNDFPSVMPHIKALSRDSLIGDASTTFEWLESDPQVDATRVACVGFCLGGRASFLANTELPLRAAISFYAGGMAGDILAAANQQRSPILFFWGGLDKNITPEIRSGVAAAMREAHKSFVNVEFSDADHGFLRTGSSVYHDAAASQAWALMIAFLAQNLR